MQFVLSLKHILSWAYQACIAMSCHGNRILFITPLYPSQSSSEVFDDEVTAVGFDDQKQHLLL